MTPCERCSGRRVVLVGWEAGRDGCEVPVIITCPECTGTGNAPHPGPPVRS